MDTEDFSFPRISDTCADNIDSPPLWNLSPAASPNPCQGEQNDCFGGAKVIDHQAQRKSFSCAENGRRRIDQLDDDGDDEEEEEEEEDRMDLLWEDFNFNEELSSTTGSATSSSREVVELRCAPVLAVAKTTNSGALLPSKNKSAGMVVIVKVMKKLFSIKNSQGKSQKRVR